MFICMVRMDAEYHMNLLLDINNYMHQALYAVLIRIKSKGV